MRAYGEIKAVFILESEAAQVLPSPKITTGDTSTAQDTDVPHHVDRFVLWKLRVNSRCAILYSYSTFWEHTVFLHGNWLVSLLISCL